MGGSEARFFEHNELIDLVLVFYLVVSTMVQGDEEEKQAKEKRNLGHFLLQMLVTIKKSMQMKPLQ